MQQLNLKGSVALFALALLSACGKEQAPPPPPTPTVGVVTVGEEAVVLTSELPGRIAAVETSEVRPQVSGVVRDRLFTEGAMVSKGQVLYAIEDAPYRAALASAQGQLGAAQSQINATRLQAQRYGQLVQLNAVSKQEADNANASAQQARANVAAQQAAVQSARVNLGFTRIKAPISGRIGRSLVTVGALDRCERIGLSGLDERADSHERPADAARDRCLDAREAQIDARRLDRCLLRCNIGAGLLCGCVCVVRFLLADCVQLHKLPVALRLKAG
ncbi:MAG: efflux RND transporter periplasmic adaptor subunit, partial [Sphingomonas sp.]